MGFEVIFLIILGIWLAVLTFLGIYLYRLLRKLSEGVDKNNLISLLNKVLEDEKVNTGKISDIKRYLQTKDDEDKFHIQKIGLIRYNPFEELGGDHSFSVALLDGKDSGILLTGLHTRERTRVYIKDIKRGKTGVDLSEEEKKALRSAQRVH